MHEQYQQHTDAVRANQHAGADSAAHTDAHAGANSGDTSVEEIRLFANSQSSRIESRLSRGRAALRARIER